MRIADPTHISLSTRRRRWTIRAPRLARVLLWCIGRPRLQRVALWVVCRCARLFRWDPEMFRLIGGEQQRAPSAPCPPETDFTTVGETLSGADETTIYTLGGPVRAYWKPAHTEEA